MSDNDEAASLYGFTQVMHLDGVSLFECGRCAALCRHDGMSTHDLWHDELVRMIRRDDS